MYIKKLTLKNFRNYDEQIFNFNEDINFIYGDNAQGKTNILEAIYIMSIGKSFRTNRDVELIRFDEDGYNIDSIIYKDNREQHFVIGFDRLSGKIIKINNSKINKLSDIVGEFATIVFTPDDLKMIKDSPNYRRKFLDILISQVRKKYLYDLQQYNKILEQRNALLKQLKFSKINISVLDVLDKTLAESAIKIIIRREEFIKKISKKIEDIHKKLTDNKEMLKIIYKNSGNCDKIIDIQKDKAVDEFEKNLIERREIDIQRGFTGIGPHRDDISIFINDLDLEKYGSQGQQRTVVLSLKIAELQIIKEEINDTPILLLDDVFSELDEKRKNFLKEIIKDNQVFITTANLDEIKGYEDKVINIANGKVI